MREEYVNRLKQLDPKADKTPVQQEFRAKQTEYGKAKTKEFLETHPKKTPSAITNATKSNAGVDAAGRTMKLVGRGAQVVAVGVEAANVVNAPEGEKAATAVQGVGRLGGAAIGGKVGAQVGAPYGPYGVLIGVLGGGILGSLGGEAYAEALTRPAAPLTEEEYYLISRGL